jgi:hypothetical protein
MSYETIADTPRTDAVANHINEVASALAHARELERELNWLRSTCRIVYYPPDDRYPIEHTAAARKDQFDAIIAEMPRNLPKPD